jgi:CheY-like chemotaxis protein
MTIGRAGDTGVASAPSEPVHRVLLVDDNVDEREAIECFLETEGLDVCCASDGREALYATAQRATSLSHSAGTSTCRGWDGWEFRRRQLLWPQMAGIPVVVLSGHPEVKAVTRGMQAREVWQKPVVLDQLVRAVGEHCAGTDGRATRGRRRSGTPRPLPLRELPGKRPPMLRMVRCHECPHDKRHARDDMRGRVLHRAVLAVTSCRRFGPQVGQAIRGLGRCWAS